MLNSNYILVASIIIIPALVIYCSDRTIHFSNYFFTSTDVKQTLCTTTEKERVVRGDSLSGLLENKQSVKTLENYYNCNDVNRDDVVLYDYIGNEKPLIKIVKAIPGDKLSLVEVDGGWNIKVNDVVLENSDGVQYLINAQKYKMLALYEKQNQGIIPQNSYLLLGNLPSATLDSSRFGLVDKADIIAKVVLN